MLILTDCLTVKPDEGCLKVAASLVKRLKQQDPRVRVISYGKTSPLADRHLRLNKLFLNPGLLREVAAEKGSVLYIPNASCTTASAMRLWVLSLFAKKPQVLFALRHPVGKLTKWLLRLSKARLLCLSAQSAQFYAHATGCQTLHLKTGVDTGVFCPVSREEKQALRRKYGIGETETVLLHVGHLKMGRNLDKLCDLHSRYRLLLVISSNTQPQQTLRQQLLERPNTTLVEAYQSAIWELYQLSDGYVFPVVEGENCIDVPLSVLEAAACGVPAVVTDYGELKCFRGKPGFIFPEDFTKENLDTAVRQALAIPVGVSRQAVLDYDWSKAAKLLGEEENG